MCYVVGEESLEDEEKDRYVISSKNDEQEDVDIVPLRIDHSGKIC